MEKSLALVVEHTFARAHTCTEMSKNGGSLEIGFKLGHLLVLAVSSSGQFV